MAGNNITIKTSIANEDFLVQGNDGGNSIDAFHLDMSEAGAATFLGAVTANAGINVDNLNLNGSTLTSTGDFIVNATADINLDAGGGDWRLKDDDATICTISNVSGDLQLLLGTADKDFKFQGTDGSSQITALQLDMSDAGKAIFNAGGKFNALLDTNITHTSTDVTAANSNTTVRVGNSGSGNGVYNALKFSGNQQDMYIMSINHGTESLRRMGFFLGSVAGDAVADERLSITGAGKVHIGNTFAADGSYDNLVVGTGSGNEGMTIYGAANGASSIAFADPNDNDVGNIMYDHSSNFMRFNTNAGERMRIESTGKTMIGATSPVVNCMLTVRGNYNNERGLGIQSTTAGGDLVMFYATAQVGTITSTGGGTNYNSASDYRLKENVNYDWDATTRLKQLKPARFNWINDETNTLIDGFLAHEVEDVVSHAVRGTKDAVDENGDVEPQSIDQSKLVPLLVKAIQEQQALIESLTARITTLEG